jgi:hypothetical protein
LNYFFLSGSKISPIPSQVGHRIPLMRPEPRQTGHRGPGDLVEAVIESNFNNTLSSPSEQQLCSILTSFSPLNVQLLLMQASSQAASGLKCFALQRD